jgi:hypothetical protein
MNALSLIDRIILLHTFQSVVVQFASMLTSSFHLALVLMHGAYVSMT